jgi:hypothetical protein
VYITVREPSTSVLRPASVQESVLLPLIGLSTKSSDSRDNVNYPSRELCGYPPEPIGPSYQNARHTCVPPLQPLSGRCENDAWPPALHCGCGSSQGTTSKSKDACPVKCDPSERASLESMVNRWSIDIWLTNSR